MSIKRNLFLCDSGHAAIIDGLAPPAMPIVFRPRRLGAGTLAVQPPADMAAAMATVYVVTVPR